MTEKIVDPKARFAEIRAKIPQGMTVAEYIEALADLHGVVFVRTPIDDFADAANRLVGDNLPPPDDTMNLMVALYRAGFLQDGESTLLLAMHLEEERAGMMVDRKEGERA